MPDWFETTGDSYFKHVNRTTIELSVAEARGSDAELSVRAAAKKCRHGRRSPCCRKRLDTGPGAQEAEQEPKSESIADDEQFPQAAE